MTDQLTKAERDCCHMNQWDRFTSLAEWREEFRTLDRSEHCRDCPAIPATDIEAEEAKK